MHGNERKRNGLHRLVRRILASEGEDGTWSVTTDELCRTLGETQERFTRVLYGLKGRIDYSAALDTLDSGRTGDLVTILEGFYGPAAEAVLREAGLFLSHDDHIELTEYLLRSVHEAVRRHRIDLDQFRAMLRLSRGFPEAFEIYLREHLPLDPITAEAVRRFGAADCPAARRLAADYLEGLFRRHILSREKLFEEVESTLRRRLYGEARNEAERPTDAVRRIAAARDLLGITAVAPETNVLRSRYRSLMKRYHPDVNPRGLEMCKAVNAAYALLLPLCRD